MGRLWQMLLGLALVMGISGCAGSGRPLSPGDQRMMNGAFLLIGSPPQLNKRVEGREFLLLGELFDGTTNNKDSVSVDERATIIGYIHDRLVSSKSFSGLPICGQDSHLCYHSGAGTQGSWLWRAFDTAFGASLESTAQQAAENLIRKVDRYRGFHPHGDVRIFVSGFSRGAATARHFMNLVDAMWRDGTHVGEAPRFYAVLFDTVATGARARLNLGIPATVDVLYHFVSVDERRLLFGANLDDLRSEPWDDVWGRVRTIFLPGAHSDVGASYLEGVGEEYRTIIESLLAGMGLIENACFTVPDGVRDGGKHDSRTVVEKVVGIAAPNSIESINNENRRVFVHPIEPVENSSAWRSRINDLTMDHGFSKLRCVQNGGFSPLEFNLKYINGRFSGSYDWNVRNLELTQVGFEVERGQNFFLYAFNDRPPSRLKVSSALFEKIKDEGGGRLAIGLVRRGDGSGAFDFWFFWNDYIFEKIN